MDWKKLGKKLLAQLDWKELLLDVYKGLRPQIAAKVNDSSSKWDDMAFTYCDALVLKFLGDDALAGEDERAALVAKAV